MSTSPLLFQHKSDSFRKSRSKGARQILKKKGKDHMSIRFITKTIHAYLDYPVAISLMAMPFILDLGSTNNLAIWVSVVTGIAAFILTLFTDHKLGLIRIIPYWAHVLVDFLVGITFILVPFIFNFSGLDAWYYWANAAAVLTAVSLSKPGALSEDETAAI
jgi:hypothetical protein